MVSTHVNANERFARVGKIELCYEELGNPEGEPMLLVMGLGTQLIHWDRRFCEMLGDREAWLASPAVADLDGDGKNEVIAARSAKGTK